MSVTKELAANTSVVFISNDTRDYAQITSGNLSNNLPGTLPTGFTYSAKMISPNILEFVLDDSDIKYDGSGIAYYGVEARRRK